MSQDPPAPTEQQADAPSPERGRMLAYLRSRAATLGPAEIRARFHTAAADFEASLVEVTEAQARRQPVATEWSIAQVVDHLAQTTIRSAEELRHLLSGRRPPAPPVYEALTSGAAAWVSWEELRQGFRSANDEFERLLATATGGDESARPSPEPGPTAPTILVVNRAFADGRVAPDTFVAELPWKEYALVQRLHLLDHRTQVRTLRAAPER